VRATLRDLLLALIIVVWPAGRGLVEFEVGEPLYNLKSVIIEDGKGMVKGTVNVLRCGVADRGKLGPT